MTREQTKMVLTMLATSYNKRLMPELNEYTINLWHKMLEDVEYESIGLVVQKWIMTEKFPPSIADIRQAVAELYIDGKDASEAWREIKDAVRKFGSYEEETALNSLSADTRRVVERFEYKKFCMMEEKDERTFYAQFRDAYNSLATREKTEKQLPAELNDKIKMLADKMGT